MFEEALNLPELFNKFGRKVVRIVVCITFIIVEGFYVFLCF